MATEAPVNIAPPERSTAGHTAADGFIWQPDSVNMHVLRPKSAKGRTRPSPHRPQGTEPGPHRPPAALPPAMPCEPPSGQRPGACAPRKSLEEGSVETVVKQAGSLRLSGTVKKNEEESRAPASSPERKVIIRTRRQTSPRAGDPEEPSDQEPRLLLAVRSPSGRRFVHHFRPTDALQMVVAVAEDKNQASYQPCSIETMEVPRRRFSDLTRSLQECRIPHKSVLGISQEEGEGEP
ncbi:UBX domain-containing protein 10 isoform X2 [Mustela nigripes]|uniref:UBX domain-containing protein 10 isoform X2 n=1 Tax=Mustela nigripes TaxID=77151 RepID=UPI00281524C8|nr:UBX domain-containing protein 10 isoform X2 [Mustela nigripes]